MKLNSGYVYRHRVAVEHAGMAVLDYHVRRFARRTAEDWLRTLEAGHLRINGRTACSSDVLRPGDRLEYHREPWSEPEAPLEFTVHFEDQDVLVVAKPAGLQVLPAGPFLEHTLLRQVRSSEASRAASSPVHRLGRGTSGLILFGKSERARAELSRQFRDFEPRKTYLARVDGARLPTSVVARHPIGPVPHGLLQLHVALSTGKPARTRVRVLRRETGSHRALVAAQPITGRPDQIRVHLAALGAPIVGDPLFGPGGVPISDAPPGAGGYFLHAAALSFRHPLDGNWIRCRSLPAWLEGR